MSEANLLYCNSSLLAWLVSRKLHNLLWNIKVLFHGWISNMKIICPGDMCVFANSVWNLNKLNNKLKFIDHGDLTVIQQPVISC